MEESDKHSRFVFRRSWFRFSALRLGILGFFIESYVCAGKNRENTLKLP
jgi:hypothetical protein